MTDPKVIQGVKPDTKPTLPNSHSWGLFCDRIQDPLLLSGCWVEGKKLGGKLGPFWMAVEEMGLGEEREYLQPQTRIQPEGLFPIILGEGKRVLPFWV